MMPADIQAEWKAKKERADRAWNARMSNLFLSLEQRQKALCQLNGWEYDTVRLWTDGFIESLEVERKA